MESKLFEGVDEEDKAKFVGNFFSWVRNMFKKEPKKKEPYGSLVEHQEKEEKEQQKALDLGVE